MLTGKDVDGGKISIEEKIRKQKNVPQRATDCRTARQSEASLTYVNLYWCKWKL
jgi:hypothetical protein